MATATKTISKNDKIVIEEGEYNLNNYEFVNNGSKFLDISKMSSKPVFGLALEIVPDKDYNGEPCPALLFNLKIADGEYEEEKTKLNLTTVLQNSLRIIKTETGYTSQYLGKEFVLVNEGKKKGKKNTYWDLRMGFAK